MTYNSPMQQYFLDASITTDVVALPKDILHHLKIVLRRNDGYKMRLVDSEGKVYLAELIDEKAKIIETIEEDRELPSRLIIALALIKHDRFEWAIQKCTELGATDIIPLLTKRTVIKAKEESKRITRYKRIAKEAAEQSLRNRIPEIWQLTDIKDIIKIEANKRYIAYEKEDTSVLPDKIDGDTLIVIGPEGGFTDEEATLLISHGFISITLGPRILRAETAAIVATTLIGRALQ